MNIVTTSLYAGFFALLYLMLSLYVVRKRWRHQVGLGDGGKREMLRAIRIHGNFVEYVPMALIIMLILELGAKPPMAIHGLGSILVAGRILHIFGLLKTVGTSSYRIMGMVLTYLVYIVGGLMCLYQSVS